MLSYIELEELENSYANGSKGAGLRACLQVLKSERDKELKERSEMLIAQYDRLKTRYNRILRIIRDYRTPDDDLLQETETYLNRLKKNKEKIAELRNIKF